MKLSCLLALLPLLQGADLWITGGRIIDCVADGARPNVGVQLRAGAAQ